MIGRMVALVGLGPAACATPVKLRDTDAGRDPDGGDRCSHSDADAGRLAEPADGVDPGIEGRG